MSRYNKAIAAAVSLLLTFAFEGKEAIDVDEVEVVITAIVTAIVWAIPNRGAA